MLSTLDRYLLRQIVTTGAVILVLGLTTVMLERLLALLRIVGDLDKVLTYLGQMLFALTPHYLGLVLPAAFFFGVLLTLGRLSRDSELAAVFAVGAGLPRVLAPIMGLAVVLTVIAAIILGFVTPHARYAYRSFKHTVTHASLSASITAGTFIDMGDVTFFAEGAVREQDRLRVSNVFVYQDNEDGGAVMTTAEKGVLVKLPGDEGLALILTDGERTDIEVDGAHGPPMAFDQLRWPILAADDATYGPRGRDRRELTLTELWTARLDPPKKPSLAQLESELQLRLVTIASIPALPLLAAALALAGGRTGRGHGIVAGLLILVIYHKMLASGDASASRDLLSPWLGLWLPFALFGLGSAFLCYRTAFKVPRIAWWDYVMDQLQLLQESLNRRFARRRDVA